jgi:hypothetical protein
MGRHIPGDQRAPRSIPGLLPWLPATESVLGVRGLALLAHLQQRLRTAHSHAVYLEVDDLAAAGVEIEDEVRLPAKVEAEIERLTRRRSEADALRSEVAAETRKAAAELRRAGLSTRDVGEILGISGARVAQIEREPLPVG